MKVSILEEHGHILASFGMGLSFGKTSDMSLNDFIGSYTQEKLYYRTDELAHRQGGHNKFLESVVVWLDITAPRYWWQQADTYRMATKQSESTMHRKAGDLYTAEDFEGGIWDKLLYELNMAVARGDKQFIQANRPESFLQRRIVCCSYKTLQNMYNQRHNHKLKQWHTFCDALLDQLQCPQWIKKDIE